MDDDPPGGAGTYTRASAGLHVLAHGQDPRMGQDAHREPRRAWGSPALEDDLDSGLRFEWSKERAANGALCRVHRSRWPGSMP